MRFAISTSYQDVHKPTDREGHSTSRRTPKAFHSKAQGRPELVEERTLGQRPYATPTLKALNKPLNNDVVKPFQGRDHCLTRFPACYAGLSYRTPSAYLILRRVFTRSTARCYRSPGTAARVDHTRTQALADTDSDAALRSSICLISDRIHCLSVASNFA